MITNENLRNRHSRWQPMPLETGAASFKRVLGGNPPRAWSKRRYKQSRRCDSDPRAYQSCRPGEEGGPPKCAKRRTSIKELQEDNDCDWQRQSQGHRKEASPTLLDLRTSGKHSRVSQQQSPIRHKGEQCHEATEEQAGDECRWKPAETDPASEFE